MIRGDGKAPARDHSVSSARKPGSLISRRCLVLAALSAVAVGCRDRQGQSPDAGHAPSIDAGSPDATSEDAAPPTDAPSADADSEVDAAPPPDAAPLPPNSIELIGHSVCESSPYRHRRCFPDTITIPADFIPAGGPVRTRITRRLTGNCSSQFPRDVLIRLDDGSETPLSIVPFEHPDGAFVQRDDGAATASLTLEDSSYWADVASYHISCRMWLEIEFNGPATDR